VLKSANALEMYRQQYHSINHHDVAQFLLFSQAFPRSIRFCLESAAFALNSLTRDLNEPNKAMVEIAILNRTIETTDTMHIIDTGLHEFIDVFQANLNMLDQAIFESFFEV